MDYKFYFKQLKSEDDTEYEVSETWPSMHITSVKGLMVKGNPTNFYVESYVDSDEVRSYIGDSAHKTSTVEIGAIFFGDTFLEDFEAFEEFISANWVEYHDSYRNKTVQMHKSKATKISSDKRLEGDKHIKCIYYFEKGILI